MAQEAMRADYIFHNGKVVSVDGSDSIEQAIAITGTTIRAVGSNEDILPLAGRGTRIIDLGGRTMVPGIIDTHAHMDREGPVPFAGRSNFHS